MFVTCFLVHPKTSHYGAQVGLYTMTGRWNAFNGSCGRGLTTASGVVSCRTTSACRRRSRLVCAGDSNRCVSRARHVTVDVDVVVIASPSPCVQGVGLVGGVKNISSSETSPIDPMASGHLVSHFHTAARTRLTSKRGMARDKRQAEQRRGGGIAKWVEMSKS